MRRLVKAMFMAWLFGTPLAMGSDGVEPAGGGRPYVRPLNPGCQPIPWAPGTPGMTPGMTPETTPVPVPGTDPMAPSPLDAINNPFAQATEAGGLASVSFNESFDGDNLGVFYRGTVANGFTETTGVIGTTTTVVGTQLVQIGTTPQQVVVGNTTVTVQVPVFQQVDITQTTPVTGTIRTPVRQIIRVPVAGRYNGIQIVDNDNPRPVDRVYFGYNGYSNVGASLNAPSVGGSSVNRETMGFEKTFLDGNASFGMRLPFIQQNGPLGIGAQNVGDLTLLLKYAFINNRETGNVASVGLAITTPTGGSDIGGDFVLLDGGPVPHSYLLQPWAGFVRVYDRAYVQGISNLIVPTDNRDVTLWGNSLGVGYWLYRNANDRMLNGIIPVAELHVRTPLNHRNEADSIFMMDQVNLTAGVHFRFTRATISGAVCVPLAGPIPWSVEGMGFINYRF